jgi:hypothetical protein
LEFSSQNSVKTQYAIVESEPVSHCRMAIHSRFTKSQSAFQADDTENTSMILKARLEEIISTSDASTQLSNIANSCHHNENKEVHLLSPKVEP